MSVATWTHRRLRFDAHLNPVKSELKLANDAQVSFVPMDAVGERGGLRLEEERPVDEVYNGYTYFRDGDVVIAKITPCFENGKGAIAEGLTNGVGFGTTELHVVRPSEQLDDRFLFYVTIAHDFRSFGASEMLGAGGQKRVPERFLKDWRPSLPPLETQKCIAAFLDEKTARIDALIAKKQALLERLAEKRQAIITQAVTKGLNPAAPMKDSDIDWLGQIPAHWETYLIKRKYTVTYGVGGEIDRSLESGTNLLSLPNISKDGRLILDETPFTEVNDPSVLLKPGDLLFNWRNGSSEHLGKTVLFDLQGDWTHVSFLLRIRPSEDSACTTFLRYFLNGMRETGFFAKAKAGVNNTFNLFELENLVIVAPPTRAEQQLISKQIETDVSKIDIISTTLEKSTTALAEYRSALITAAVTGQMEINHAPEIL